LSHLLLAFLDRITPTAIDDVAKSLDQISLMVVAANYEWRQTGV
jgi:hypothetical protein